MRILELTDLYPPFIGGLERHVQLLAGGLARRGHDVAVATGATPTAPAGRSGDGDVVVHRLAGWNTRLLAPFYASADRPFSPPVPDPGLMGELRRVLVEHRPDVVHAHSWNVFSLLPLVQRLGVPTVVTAHDYGLVCPKKTSTLSDGSTCDGPSLRRCLPCSGAAYGPAKGAALTVGLRASRRSLRSATVVNAVSQYVADQLTPVLAPVTGQAVGVLHSFVPEGLRASGLASAAPDWLPSGDFVLYVGALSDHKGVRTLLQAHARLRHRVPLVLLGTPSASTPSPEELAADVVLVTDVPHEQVVAAMVRAAVSVAPSLWPDPLPMTVSEAQLCGVPVVGSRIGGIPEQLLDGRTGLLVEPGDPSDLAAALDDLLGDPVRRRRMGQEGQRWARRFELPLMIETVADVLAAAAACRPQGAVAARR